MIHLLTTLSFATEPVAHRFDTRVELAQMKVGDTHLSLVIGPCAKDCVLAVEGKGTKETILPLSPNGAETPGSYKVWTEEDVFYVQIGEGYSFNVRWQKAPEQLGMPAVLVHTVAGYEHVTDLRTLLAVDPKPREVWSGTSMPRDAGEKALRFAEVGGHMALISTTVFNVEPTEPAQWSVAAHRTSTDGKSLVRMPDAKVPVYTVIAGSHPSVKAAKKAQLGAKCLNEYWVLSSDEFPKLTPGLSLIGKLTTDKGEAEAWLKNAKTCQADAYIKRGR